MPSRAVALSFILVTIASASAPAQTRWERQVSEQLRVIATDIAPAGWRYAGDPLTGELRQGQDETLRVALRGGVEYALVALCDEDCRDIEVAVLGADDVVVARSEGWSARPILELRPTESGKYRVVVTMSHCGTSPCAYGVGLFQK